MKALVTYASRHGSTMGIAERIAGELEKGGVDVDLRPVQDVAQVTGYDAIVLGSAVYFGSWLKPAIQLARRNQAELSRRPVWVFSSGPVGDAVLPPPKETAELQETIRPRDHRVFAGAIEAGRLGRGERLITRMVHASYVDSRSWAEIASWAAKIASELAAPPVVAG